MKKIDEKQLTLKDSLTLRCRLWCECAYHECPCDAYHDPRKNPRMAREQIKIENED